MKKNRNLVTARVSVSSDVYASMLTGSAATGDVVREVVSVMNRTAAERERRVLGEPVQTDAVETDGSVALTFEACTEPA